MDDISVIIRVRNEERWIGHAIQSVLDKFDHPELIIIDNQSKDISLRIANLFKHDTSLPFSDKRYTSVHTLSIKDYRPGRAINLGVKKASRKYLLVLSAHCTLLDLPKETLFKDLEKYPAVFGKQIPHYYGKRIKPNYIWSHFVDHQIENMYSELEGRHFFHNAFSFFNRDFINLFPMNEDLIGKEDRYWAHKTIREGYKYLYQPELVVNHHFTENGNTWRGVG